MSRIEPRRLALLAAFALALRLGCAALTEVHPLFPDYYYTDIAVVEAAAVRTLATESEGRSYVHLGSLSERIQIRALTALYRAVGHRPFAAKLFSSALGTAAALLLALALAPVFGAGPALASGALYAAWPSGIFFTSHFFKEAPTAVFSFAALWGLLTLLVSDRPVAHRTAVVAGVTSAALVGVGLYRSYVLLALCVAFLAAAVWTVVRGRRAVSAPASVLLACLLACAVYPYVGRFMLARAQQVSADGVRSMPLIIPVTVDDYDPGTVYRPTSPEGITSFRKTRQSADRRWARQYGGRTISTQIFPDAEFKTWLDVALYLPKGMSHVLFMPLPGFYPIDGKIGRLGASLENLVLLLVCIAGVAGVSRGPLTEARMAPLAFLAVMATGAALLEFDLGSSARHKLLYLPMLFPFAAEELQRRLSRRRRA